MRLNAALLAPLAIFAGLGIAFFWAMNRDEGRALPSAFVGRPAPGLDMPALADLPLARTEDLHEEGWKLVNFWASWCPPCRAEHPTFVNLANEGWKVIGVNKSDTEANALAFLGELGDPYVKHAADPNGRQAIDWGVYGLPETFLVDDKGMIRLRFPGPVTSRVWERQFLPIIEADGPAQ